MVPKNGLSPATNRPAQSTAEQHFSLLSNTGPNALLAGHWKCPLGLPGPVQGLRRPQEPELATLGDLGFLPGCYPDLLPPLPLVT